MPSVVHLELHTGDLSRACAFYEDLCGWRPARVQGYTALALADRLGGGVVECGTRKPVWLPYVEVADVTATTERARELGAAVLLEKREGPAGWRSVIEAPEGGELALWQPKR